jgi:chromosome segregation protein
MADDLMTLTDNLDQEVADETALRERRTVVETALEAAVVRETDLDGEIAGDAPAFAQAQDTWFRLSSLRERVRSTAALAGERVKNLAPEPEEERRGREPEELEAEAASVRADESALQRKVLTDRELLAESTTTRAAIEADLAAEDKRLSSLVRAAADRREGLVRLTGQVHAAQERLEARTAELDRLTAQIAEARARSDKATADFHTLETQVAGLDEGEVGLDTEHESAARTLAETENRLSALRITEQEVERDRHALAARVEALELGLARKDGGAAVMAAGERLSGVLGTVAALVQVRSGFQTAVSAALGPLADAVAVGSAGRAVDALSLLKSDDAGRASLLVGGVNTPDRATWPELPSGAQWAIDVITAPDELRGSLLIALDRVAVVDDLTIAQSLISTRDVIAVTRDGDVLGQGFAYGGSSSAPSLLEVQAAVD